MEKDLLLRYIRESLILELRPRRARISRGTGIFDKITSLFSKSRQASAAQDINALNSALEDWFGELEITYDSRISSGKKNELRRVAQRLYSEMLAKSVESGAAIQKTIGILNRRYAQEFA